MDVKSFFEQAKILRCVLFKQLIVDQGVNKLPRTQWLWIEHISHAHAQFNIWRQEMVLSPTCLDPLTLGWRNLHKKLLTILSQVAPAPVSELQFVRYNCEKSKCLRKCSCRGNNVVSWHMRIPIITTCILSVTILANVVGKVTVVRTLHHQWLVKI